MMVNSEKMEKELQILLLAMAVAFIIVGIARGEQLTVLKKAVRICLECIGIG